MPGMNSGLSDTNPILVAAFKAALLHQGLIVLALLLLLGLAWAGVREWVPAARRLAERPGPRPRSAGWAVQLSRAAGGCCGSASASCGSSTGSCRRSRRWRPACPGR